MQMVLIFLAHWLAIAFQALVFSLYWSWFVVPTSIDGFQEARKKIERRSEHGKLDTIFKFLYRFEYSAVTLLLGWVLSWFM